MKYYEKIESTLEKIENLLETLQKESDRFIKDSDRWGKLFEQRKTLQEERYKLESKLRCSVAHISDGELYLDHKVLDKMELTDLYLWLVPLMEDIKDGN